MVAASVSAQAWAAVIAGVGVVMSLIGSAIFVSYRVGKIEAELRSAASTSQSESTAAINEMSRRLARIEGMFELRLKDWPAQT